MKHALRTRLLADKNGRYIGAQRSHILLTGEYRWQKRR